MCHANLGRSVIHVSVRIQFYNMSCGSSLVDRSFGHLKQVRSCYNLCNGSMVSLCIGAHISGHTEIVWRTSVHEKTILRSVILKWAHANQVMQPWENTLPTDVRVTSRPDGCQLKLTCSVEQLVPMLAVTSHGFLITVIWPDWAERSSIDGKIKCRRKEWNDTVQLQHRKPFSFLQKLRISKRYASMLPKDCRYHCSKKRAAQHRGGKTSRRTGTGSQKEMICAMSTAFCLSLAAPRDNDVQRCILVVLSRNSVTGFQQELFQAVLTGPVCLVRNWEVTCERFQQRDATLRNTLCPVFIPTRGRPTTARLNWYAHHVFGSYEQACKNDASPPVVCIVVEPQEEQQYRAAWPHALMLVLPANDRGPGFARWVIQQVCTKHQVIFQQVCTRVARRLPWIWIADDTLSAFYRLTSAGFFNSDMQRSQGKRYATGHIKEREHCTFHEAFFALQRHPQLSQMAMAGFLRDDGTAVCKTKEWNADVVSLYKVVLLNLSKLKRIEVAYLADLQCFEDICFNTRVLEKNGRTLKCQTFCFNASHPSSGGCSKQREQCRVKHEGKKMRLDNLIAPAKFKMLTREEQCSIWNVLNWARSPIAS